ncbi:MAG: Fic family protein [Coriobacteriales bacterium]|jgi:Fic family protein|nr:Fic family protein [Coriobacteriales bacterium]
MELPDFKVTEEIEGLALEIVEILEVMERVGDIDTLFKLRRAGRISSIQSSVAIEANSLTLEQVTDIVNGRKVIGDPKEIQEVKNAWEAYEGIGEYDPYSRDSFLEAHKRMSSKLVREAGRFRSVQVGVYKGFELIHDGARPEEIERLMDIVFEWGLKSNAHPLIKSCVMHFLIEFVHPFEDGNGRMGRLWQTVILADWKPILQWVPVETMVYQNQYGYYQALHTSEEAGDAGPFVVFMLDIIAYTLGVIVRSKALPQRRVGETVSIPYLPDFSGFPDNRKGHIDETGSIPDRAGALTDKIPDIFTDKLTKGEKEFLSAIYLYLCEHGEINNYRAQTLTGKSADSAKKYLAKLVSAGLLQAVGNNKARVYRFADFTT